MELIDIIILHKWWLREKSSVTCAKGTSYVLIGTLRLWRKLLFFAAGAEELAQDVAALFGENAGFDVDFVVHGTVV